MWAGSLASIRGNTWPWGAGHFATVEVSACQMPHYVPARGGGVGWGAGVYIDWCITIISGRVEKTDPRSADYPTDYSADYTHRLPYIINQIYFYGGRDISLLVQPARSKQPPFSFHRLPRPSLFFFIFAPFFIGHQSKHCFHNGRSVSAVEYWSF